MVVAVPRHLHQRAGMMEIAMGVRKVLFLARIAELKGLTPIRATILVPIVVVVIPRVVASVIVIAEIIMIKLILL